MLLSGSVWGVMCSVKYSKALLGKAEILILAVDGITRKKRQKGMEKGECYIADEALQIKNKQEASKTNTRIVIGEF